MCLIKEISDYIKKNLHLLTFELPSELQEKF